MPFREFPVHKSARAFGARRNLRVGRELEDHIAREFILLTCNPRRGGGVYLAETPLLANKVDGASEEGLD